MEIKTVCLALDRRHRGSLTGISILILLLSLTLLSALTVWQNAGDYVYDEMAEVNPFISRTYESFSTERSAFGRNYGK